MFFCIILLIKLFHHDEVFLYIYKYIPIHFIFVCIHLEYTHKKRKRKTQRGLLRGWDVFVDDVMCVYEKYNNIYNSTYFVVEARKFFYVSIINRDKTFF